jgi:hypothetical protein
MMMNSAQVPQRRTGFWSKAIPALLCGCFFAMRAGAASPILILTNAADAFSQYYEQIIQTEGLNEYALGNVTSVTNGILGLYDVALLAPTALTAVQATTISNWVNGGGTLIAVRPDKRLAGLLGLVDAGATLSEGYLLISTNTAPGAGLVNQTLQFHGTADAYTLGGASTIATLYSNAVTPTVYPAVTVQSVGASGGQAAAITLDLARSISLTRQGNPAWIDQARDGLSPTRSDDLFYGPASFDPQPSYVDFNRITIPQADEQQRLLANMIINMNAARRLLPRFWYFPHGYRAAVIMSGDDHGNGGTGGRFNQYLAYSPTNGTVADWTAIRGASYVFTEPTLLSNSQASAFNAAGFEIGLHLNTGCANYTFAQMDAFFTNQLSGFNSAYPSLPSQVTERIHCIAWSGYTIAPQDELQHGIRLDVSYYYYPTNWVADRPGMFTGSAIPMRFVTTNGNLIDVFQAPSQMTDESGQSYPKTINALLDGALGPQQYYGAYVANMHTDNANSPGSDLIVMSAVNRGVPVVSPRQMLTWLDARNASSMSSINWTNNTLSFSVSAAANSTGLEVMVPIPAGLSVSNVTYNGGATGYFLRGVNGMQYAFINGLSGSYVVACRTDTAAPTVASVVPANGATAVAQSPGVSVAFSEVLNQATVNTNTISLRNATNGVVPATVSYNPATLTVVLTPNNPLALASSFTVRVNGGGGGVADVAGNVLAANFTSSFSTIPQIDYSIWTNGTEPAVASAVDTNSLEVGLKFRSMVSGYISGVRFFKGCFNKGTHIGNLWTTNGVLLASTTYTNETFAGWQSQAFATPVHINSNTTYVVSCFEPVGGYPTDVGYFAGSGYTNYPLYALADGVNGGNSVFVYSATSKFPNQTFQSENLWVDVVFHLAGTSLMVTTSSLSNGVLNLAYTATLTATGGTNPYTWSIISGALPPGLNLNTNSGVISGTPGNIGTYNFTVQVADSSHPVQTAVEPLSLTVVTLGPLLPAQPNRVVNELTALMVTNTAVDSSPVSYTLTVTNLATGLAVTNAGISTNGIISWTPTEAQGPSSNRVVTVASDASLSATNSFVVFVNEVNLAPVLPNQSNITIDVLTPLVVTNTATDSDIPANTLTYMLMVAPASAAIDDDGVITWIPSPAQGGTTNQFVTVVTDNGVPPLSATNSFKVLVNPASVIPAPVIQSITISNDVVTITWSSVSNALYRLQYNSDLNDTNWLGVLPDIYATGPITTGTNATGGSALQFYRIMVIPQP